MNADQYDALRHGFDPRHFDLKTNGRDSDANVKGDSTMQHLLSAPSALNIKSVWQAQVARTSSSLGLEQQFLQREDELLSRFAEHYEKLKQLPRRMRRSLQRHWKRSLAGVALLFALGQTPAMSATINVGGVCTLVRAIVAANNNTTAAGHCKKGNGADQIVLPRNSTQTLTTVNNSVFGATGLPVLRSNIIIEGNNSTIRRAPSAPNFRIIAIGKTGFVSLNRTRVSGGVASGAEFPGNNVGGGLLNSGGFVDVVYSTLSNNSAMVDGGASNRKGRLRFLDSTISANSADSQGAGVGNYSGRLILDGSTISGNTISGNTPFRSGAAVYNHNGFLSVTNSTISGNTGNKGGGVDTAGETAILTNSTITGNTASKLGGGVNSFATDLILTRNLISGNTAPNGSEVYTDRDFGSVTAGNFNVFGHSGETNARALVGLTPGATDITATSNGNTPTALAAILNTTLANNGGPTRTHALVAGSPAVDSVSDGTCPPPGLDQRFVSRPQDGNGDGGPACDTGSFELQ